MDAGLIDGKAWQKPRSNELDTKIALRKLPDIKLESTWNFNGLDATLNASYINNSLEIRGNATYTAKPDDITSKIQHAEFTVLVTTQTKAWDEVNQQLPESADGEKDARQDLTSREKPATNLL